MENLTALSLKELEQEETISIEGGVVPLIIVGLIASEVLTAAVIGFTAGYIINK